MSSLRRIHVPTEQPDHRKYSQLEGRPRLAQTCAEHWAHSTSARLARSRLDQAAKEAADFLREGSQRKLVEALVALTIERPNAVGTALSAQFNATEHAEPSHAEPSQHLQFYSKTPIARLGSSVSLGAEPFGPELCTPLGWMVSAEKHQLLRALSQLNTDRPGILEHAFATASGSDVPIVQFAAVCFFADEDQGEIMLDVMRIGNLSERSEVRFVTENASAHAGTSFKNTSGTVVFEAGESNKAIPVPIIASRQWSTTLEFAVELTESIENAHLGPYLRHTRVKVIDNDSFPSNVYAATIERGDIDSVPQLSLFWEYFKLNLSHPRLKTNIMVHILVDILHSVRVLWTLLMGVYLVDIVLDRHQEGDENKLLFGKSRMDLLMLVVLGTVLPFGMMHLADYLKMTTFGISSQVLMTLQSSLLRKFLNYSQGSRMHVSNGNLVMAMTRDCNQLVYHGFISFLQISRHLGQIVILIVYQFIAPALFGKPFAWSAVVPLVVLPAGMLLIWYFRQGVTQSALRKKNNTNDDLVESVEERIANFQLITDFSFKDKCVQDFERVVDTHNHCVRSAALFVHTNRYLAKWLILLLVCSFMLFEGSRVIKGHSTLGMFITNIHVYRLLGNCWRDIYGKVLEMSSAFPALERIVYYMNLPLDVGNLKELFRKRAVMSKDLELCRAAWRKQSGGGDDASDTTLIDMRSAVDRLPIILGNLSFTYYTPFSVTALTHVTFGHHSERNRRFLQIMQGEFICLIGPNGGGKATLLRLLGSQIIPDPKFVSEKPDMNEGQWFVPLHLRVLRIEDPVFFNGTMFQNLTFGALAEDGLPERVNAICKYLNMDDRVLEHLHAVDERSHKWGEIFSRTQSQLLSLARALVSNPEVLAIHKPTHFFSDESAEHVMKVLRNYVRHRGVFQDPNGHGRRRPRTCVITSGRAEGMNAADRVFHICQKDGIRELTRADVKAEVDGCLAYFKKTDHSPRDEPIGPSSANTPRSSALKRVAEKLGVETGPEPDPIWGSSKTWS